MPTWELEDYTIWIPEMIMDVEDYNVDIHVTLKSGERYGATLFTLKNIHTLMEKDLRTGESNDGLFFWCSDPVIVLDLTEKTILDLVAYLVKSGDIAKVFDHYKDEKKPHFGDLKNRIGDDKKQYGGTMPEHVALAWHGYLAALLEYDVISPENHEDLAKRLPPLADKATLKVFSPHEDEDYSDA